MQGFGIIEVIVAMAIFVTMAATGVTSILHSFSINRLGNEETQAHMLAQQGIEAVRSIRNQNWTNMDIGNSTCGSSQNHGLATGTGSWTFSGTSQTLERFTRVITLENVCRDTNGFISSSGTVYDPDIKFVTADVTWDFTSSRTNTVSTSTYLSRFDKSIRKGGMLVYANLAGGASNDQIMYTILNSPGEWLPAQPVPDFGVPLNRPARVVNLYSSPTRNEKILVTTHVGSGAGNDQYTYAQVWNGVSWGHVIQLSSWSGVTFADSRASDGAYLANGDFFLVFEENDSTPKYAIWDGANWTIGTLPNIGGNPVWIAVAARPGTNEVMAAFKDQADDTKTIYWNGSSWVNLTTHGTATGSNAAETVDFVWSTNTPTTGALIFNEASDNLPNVRIWNGTSWSSSVENVNIGGVPRAIRIVPRPGANEFLGCFKDSVSDINCLRSNFTPSWTSPSPLELTATTDTGLQRSFAQGFETGGTLGLIVYSDNTTTPKYRTYNPSTNTFSGISSLFPLPGAVKAVRVFPHPDSDDILVLMMDAGLRLHTRVWDGTTNTFNSSSGYGQTTHGTAGSNTLDMWADFAWDKL